MRTLALLQEVKTIAQLGPAIEQEGGQPNSLGILGWRTLEMRKAADSAAYQWKQSQDAARDAKARFEKQQNALVNHGILTSSNVRNAIPKLQESHAIT